MTRTTISKRILMMFLASWITFISVFGAYQETVKSAELLASIGGIAGSVLTALMVTGVVVAGGIAVYEIATTDSEDYKRFYDGLKQGFNEFVAERETAIAKEQDSSLTDQEASDIGVANARDTVNNFFSNAIDTVGTTGKTLKQKAVDYWQLFSKIIGQVADNGINSDQQITPTSQIVAPVIGGSVTATVMANIGANCIKFDNAYYLQIGQVYLDNIYQIGDTRYNRIPFLLCNTSDGIASAWSYDVDTNSFVREAGGSYISFDGLMNTILQNTNVPIIIGDYPFNAWKSYVSDNWQNIFKVGGSSDVKNYQNTINETLNNTQIGKSISTGRRELDNTGDYIYSAFKDTSIPIKRSSLVVSDDVVTGVVGWDIPYPDVWDDYLKGGVNFPRVVGDTGVIEFPKDSSTSVPDTGDTTVSIPSDTDVSIPDDSPSAEDPDKTGDNDKPIKDVIEEQGGTFFPSAMDLTNVFPFCIPFDVIYLVDMFDGKGEQAPVITFPIVYPSSIRGVMGADSYEVVIDFQDFVVVRNVLRVFLLLLFIAGLLKVTRDLIRG